MSLSQTAAQFLMIRPAAFGFNADAALSNAMQEAPQQDAATLQARAAGEFAAATTALRAAGVQLCVQQDTPLPAKPDALFPNNWVSFHHDGTLVLYPMQPASRRPERRRDLVDATIAASGFRLTRTVDLSDFEGRGEFLEGTGSLVLDHQRRTAYACRSARTSDTLVARWCALMGYEPMVFDATDAAGKPYYHTNVMLSIGEDWALIARDTLELRDRPAVMRALEVSGRQVYCVDRAAVQRFACNILELTSHAANGDRVAVIAMSASAKAALQSCSDGRALLAHKPAVASALPTIEGCGGGSLRCMLTEIFSIP